ncbi:thioredoxin-like protein [Phlyctochytrium arcticum]|nr:thioredoxin-like protein [Phlyctochytrium arcticum]
MPERVMVYMSSVAGSTPVKKAQTRLEAIFAARKIKYDSVDVAADEEAKEYMLEKSGKNSLPQIFVDGEYKGGIEALEEANEDDAVQKWLGLA